MFKGTLMLITNVWKWDGTTNIFHDELLLFENYLHMEARLFYDIIIIGKIQNWVRALLQLEEFDAVAMLAQLYYLFPGIQKSKNNLISLDMVEYIIASALKLLAVTITRL